MSCVKGEVGNVFDMCGEFMSALKSFLEVIIEFHNKKSMIAI
jgi:hypothetical protein